MLFAMKETMATFGELERFVIRLEKESTKYDDKGTSKYLVAAYLREKMHAENSRELIHAIFMSFDKSKNPAYLDLYKRIDACFDNTRVPEQFDDYAAIPLIYVFDSGDSRVLYEDMISKLTTQIVVGDKKMSVKEAFDMILDANIVKSVLMENLLHPTTMQARAEYDNITTEEYINKEIKYKMMRHERIKI